MTETHAQRMAAQYRQEISGLNEVVSKLNRQLGDLTKERDERVAHIADLKQSIKRLTGEDA